MLINSKWLLKSVSIFESTSCLVFKEDWRFIAHEDSSVVNAGKNREIQQWEYERDEPILSYNN